MNSRKHALALARRFRTCPPSNAVSLPETDARMAAHRRRCPLCAEPGHDAPWELIAQRIADLNPASPASTSPMPAPGQLAPIAPRLACWREDLFYTPPLVLVLSVCEHLAGAVQVAQVYHDVLLAGPGDLIVEDPVLGVDSFFIECWNRYTLRREDLAAPLAVLPVTVVQAVEAMGRDPSALPAWAPIPVALIDENDPRLAFRRMEVEVGLVFASAAAEDLVDRIAPDGPGLASADKMQEALRRLVPGVRWSSRPTDVEAVLAVAELPAEFYPLAAAGEEVVIRGRRVDLAKGGPVRIHPITPRLEHVEPLAENRTGLSGRLDAVRRPGRLPVRRTQTGRTKLLAALILPTQPSIRCDIVDWDPRTGNFYIEVPTGDIGPARIELTLLVEDLDA
jgi:hypothetical protein